MVKKILRSPITSIVLFGLAALLLLSGTIGGVRAAPNETSGSYVAELALSNVGVAIVENGSVVENGGELFAALAEDFKVGKTYDEMIAVRNTGEIDEYVRVSVYRYWTDDGKRVDLDPSLIELTFAEGSGWSIDEGSSTAERTVLYYSGVLGVGEETPVITGVSVSPAVLSQITKNQDGTTYKYSDVAFHVEVVADGVQEHNGEAAMTSAWGRTNEQ